MKKRSSLATLLAICMVFFTASHAYAREDSIRIHASLKDAPDGGYVQVGTAMDEFRSALAAHESKGCTLKDSPLLSLSPEEVTITATFVCP